ncbi:putative acyl-CoA dehydrogenase YngJ [Neolecta irregularis DAH-3]|uniref:Putative acyl-CoA dehydrogenase YngJ n=1 Tax=Neolecta irregularis (strain DAH-3) TaxID=1198029 RepID=A0A1U7LNK1_NEOID|nr:putative acyl-CoA dehydrogenase YngJ [Neolecta irregularis DAH-3]|eukprot:OLL24208.1 putative acyl-CoA dehydrogenase YngJ [Neolecta irregularis DAH-3]
MASQIFGESTPWADPAWYSGQSPYYSESHIRLRNVLRKYVDEELRPHVEEWEMAGKLPDDVYKRHAARGVVPCSIWPMPHQYLGSIKLPGNVEPKDWDPFHDIICADEMSRIGYLGVMWAFGMGGSIGLPPVINYGSQSIKDELIYPILKGDKKICLAVTEPDAGSDVAGLLTTAIRKGDHYIVNGAKKWITNAIFSDYATTAVRTGGPGRRGISALVIPLNLPGVRMRKMYNSGVAASGSTYINFDDVKVPARYLLGKENDGFTIIMNFNHERLLMAVTANRMARVCLEDAINYASERNTFGKPLLEQPVIREKFGNIARHIESTHAWIEQLGYSIKMNTKETIDKILAGQIALVKVQAGRNLEFACREAQQVFGGQGFSRGGKGARVEQISRDLRVMVVGAGSEEILTELAVRQQIALAKTHGWKL